MTIKAPLGGEVISSSQFLGPVAAAVNRLELPAAGAIDPAIAQGGGEGTTGVVESGRLVQELANTLFVLIGASIVTVAKPPHLRGHVNSRIIVDDQLDEIFPAYIVGSRLQIAKVTDTGITGVDYADLNWESRRWTHEV